MNIAGVKQSCQSYCSWLTLLSHMLGKVSYVLVPSNFLKIFINQLPAGKPIAKCPFRAFASYRNEKSQKSRKHHDQISALPGEFQKNSGLLYLLCKVPSKNMRPALKTLLSTFIIKIVTNFKTI